jgi:hypothetical protein
MYTAKAASSYLFELHFYGFVLNRWIRWPKKDDRLSLARGIPGNKKKNSEFLAMSAI